MIIAGCWIAVNTLKGYTRPDLNVGLTYKSGHNIDVLVTFVVIIAVLILEVVQFVLIYTSNWAKVMLTCEYVSKSSWQNSFVEKIVVVILYNGKWKLKPWARKLGQYSLIKSFNYSPSKLLYSSWTPLHLYAPRNGQKES